MIPYSDLQRRLLGSGEFSLMDQEHLHRTRFEDGLRIIKGRDRVRASILEESARDGLRPVELVFDLGDMIVFRSEGGWCAHQWAEREGERIAREIRISDGHARAKTAGRDPGLDAAQLGASHPDHSPLGELRSGEGQLSPGAVPALPPDFPSAAEAAARYLQQVWNGRNLVAIPAEWSGPAEWTNGAAFVLHVLAAFQDAELMIERGVNRGACSALLWRLHGHTGTGKRVRLFGSSVLHAKDGAVVSETVMVDTLIMAAQARRPIVSYA